MSDADKHLYAKIGGGTNTNVHDPSKHVPRPDYLHFKKENARYTDVVNASGGVHRMYYEILGKGANTVVMIMGLGKILL